MKVTGITLVYFKQLHSLPSTDWLQCEANQYTYFFSCNAARSYHRSRVDVYSDKPFYKRLNATVFAMQFTYL